MHGGVAADDELVERRRAAGVGQTTAVGAAELPLTVTLVSVIEPLPLSTPPPSLLAELSLNRAVSSGRSCPRCCTGRRRCMSIVAAEGAVSQRGRAPLPYRPPPFTEAELPLNVQLVSVPVPKKSKMAPPFK